MIMNSYKHKATRPLIPSKEWKRGISDLSKQLAKANAQRMLRLELDDEAWEGSTASRRTPSPSRRGAGLRCGW